MVPKASLILLLCWFISGCAPRLFWIDESSSIPSCQPDRLPQWSDFMPLVPKDQRAAETAVRFQIHPKERMLHMALDHENSWVKPDLAEPKNAASKRLSEQLLSHEQVHFLISCLVVRQANFSLTEQDDLHNILELTKLKTQDLNLQYDADTTHGLNLKAQKLWEVEVMRQLQELNVKSNTPAF